MHTGWEVEEGEFTKAAELCTSRLVNHLQGLLITSSSQARISYGEQAGFYRS